MIKDQATTRRWCAAIKDELVTIMVNFDCWDYVKWTPDMNVLPNTWALSAAIKAK